MRPHHPPSLAQQGGKQGKRGKEGGEGREAKKRTTNSHSVDLRTVGIAHSLHLFTVALLLPLPSRILPLERVLSTLLELSHLRVVLLELLGHDGFQELSPGPLDGLGDFGFSRVHDRGEEPGLGALQKLKGSQRGGGRSFWEGCGERKNQLFEFSSRPADLIFQALEELKKKGNGAVTLGATLCEPVHVVLHLMAHALMSLHQHGRIKFIVNKETEKEHNLVRQVGSNNPHLLHLQLMNQ